MPQETSIGYQLFGISAELSATDYAALRGIDLSTASHSSGSVTVASTTVSVNDVGADVKSFTPNPGFAELDRTGLKDESRVTHQGRATMEATLIMYSNTDSDASFDTIIGDTSGIRLYHVIYPSGKKMTFVASAFSSPASDDEDGDLTVELTLRGAGGKPVKRV